MQTWRAWAKFSEDEQAARENSEDEQAARENQKVWGDCHGFHCAGKACAAPSGN